MIWWKTFWTLASRYYLKKLLLAHQPKVAEHRRPARQASRRKQPMQGDYVGFSIPDEFVVGYGLDYAERIATWPTSALCRASEDQVPSIVRNH